jgi:hypothetical protein
VSRPIGVSVVAISVLVSSFLVLDRALRVPGLTRRPGLFAAAIALSMLALLASHALWTFRPSGYLFFMLWALSLMLAMVMSRMAMLSRLHSIQLFAPILYVGLACAVAAVYLRRLF